MVYWSLPVFNIKLNGSFLLPNSHTLYIIRCRNRFLYYSLLYVIFSKNSFSLLSVLGVCRSSEKRVQRYSFYQYPTNFSKIFLKKKCMFSIMFTKREHNTLLYYIGRREQGVIRTSVAAQQQPTEHCTTRQEDSTRRQEPSTTSVRDCRALSQRKTKLTVSRFETNSFKSGKVRIFYKWLRMR